MGLDAYRNVLRIRDVRRVLLLSLVIRIPMWAGNIVLTLHVVTHLHRSYTEAGVLVGAATLATSISAPWRGRRLDRVGLRAAVLPSLVVLTACWSVAPFTGYWPLFVLVSVAELFVVPSFSIVRQSLMHSVDEVHRKSALAVDSVMVEISFMIGPALGVLLATYAPTSWALFACEFSSILGGLLVWILDPPLRAPATAATPAQPYEAVGVRTWMTPAVVAVLAMSAAATVVLTGTDVGVVAALRHLHHQPWIGWELTIWGLGSAIGGVIYGALHRSIPVVVLLALLAGSTLPIALATNAVMMAVLLLVAGLFCAPTVTAAVDALSRAVPERVRGEALGWHGGAMTAGSAAGAPIAGIAIDRIGWSGAFTVTAGVALLAAAAGASTMRARTRPAPREPIPGHAS